MTRRKVFRCSSEEEFWALLHLLLGDEGIAEVREEIVCWDRWLDDGGAFLEEEPA